MKHDPTAGIILAAGLSRRLGSPKQLAPYHGKPLLAWAVDAALDSNLQEIVLVLGHEAGAVEASLKDRLDNPRIRTVFNPNYRHGMAESLKTGLRQVKDRSPSVMFILGDQPLLKAETINLMLQRFWSSNMSICVPVYQGKRGNPTLFSSEFYPLLLSLSGDIGAREIIRAHPGCQLRVSISHERCFDDVDTEEDLTAHSSGPTAPDDSRIRSHAIPKDRSPGRPAPETH